MFWQKCMYWFTVNNITLQFGLFIVGSKRDVCFLCAGFICGTIAGAVLFVSVKKKNTVIRYMQAVQCINYLGVEVQFYLYVIYIWNVLFYQKKKPGNLSFYSFPQLIQFLQCGVVFWYQSFKLYKHWGALKSSQSDILKWV